jgi:hypothetical protein
MPDLGRRDLRAPEMDAVDDRVNRGDRESSTAPDDRRVVADAADDPAAAGAERRRDGVDEVEFLQRWR